MSENSNKAEYFFGNNLRSLRKSGKFTLISLSSHIDISKSALSDYETGKSLPGLDAIKKIASFFKVSIEEIYNSDISELSNNKSKIKLRNPELENEKYIFSVKLINQKLESVKVQMQLYKQLLHSREAENKSLKINIMLLEEQIKTFSKK